MSQNTENRRVNVYHNVREGSHTIKELEKKYFKLRSQVKGLNTNSKEYRQELKKLNTTKRTLDKHRQELNGVNRAWKQTKSVMLGVIGASAGLEVFRRVANFIPDLIRRNAELSDSYADVMKTTDLSREATEALSRDFKQFDTRRPRKELLALAKVAGRLNIQGRRNIRNFVEEANQIEVALGEDLGEDAVLQIGKIAAAFDVSLLQIGSAMNEIGNNSRAQEQYLVDFTARMQGAAKAAKIGAGDIVAYGGVFDAMGLKVEMTGTAMSTTLLDFVKDTDKFEQAAGMVEGSLSKMIGEKGTNEGFLGWIEALKAAHPEEEAFLKKLDEVGVSGARKSQVFLTLSQNLDEYRRQQEIANDALRDGTSVTEEYNIRNENLAATVEKIGRKMHEAFASSTIVTAIEKITTSLWNWMKIPLSEKLEEERISLRKTEMKILDLNTSQENRVGLIRELQEQYPNYLGHLNAEKATNEELRDGIKKINDQLVNKIILQKEDEKIIKQKNKEAEQRRQMISLEDQLREALVKQGVQIKDNSTLLHEAKKHYDDIGGLSDEMLEKFRKVDGVALGNTKQADQLRDLINQLELYQNKVGITTDKTNEMEVARQKLMERLSAETFYASEPGVHVGTTDPQTSNPDQTRHQEELARLQKELDKLKNKSAEDLTSQEKKRIETLGREALKMYEELMKSVAAKSDEIFYQSLPDTDQALIKLNEHYDTLRNTAQQALQSNQGDTSIDEDTRVAREQSILDRIAEINHNHDMEMDAFYEQKRLERDAKRQAEKERIYLLSQTELDQEIIQQMQQFDKLTALFDKYGADTTTLTKELEAAINAIRKRYREDDIRHQEETDATKLEMARQNAMAVGMVMQSVGDFTAALYNMIGQMGEDEANYQKELAWVNLLTQTGSAIASGVSKAMSTSSTWYEAVIAVASVAATVLSAIGTAKSYLEDASVPSAPQYAIGTGAFGHGGGRALVGEEGPEMVHMPSGSEVYTASRTAQMNAWDSQPSRSFDATAANDSVRSGYQSTSTDQSETNNLLRTLIAKQEQYQREFRVVNVKEDYDKALGRWSNVKRLGNLENKGDDTVFGK